MNDQLFPHGWLHEHLRDVVKELAALPKEQQPRLTGARAAIMDSPEWLRVTPA